jgi:hypothetical protein
MFGDLYFPLFPEICVLALLAASQKIFSNELRRKKILFKIASILTGMALEAVLRIRIHIFLGLPDPDSLVRGIDPAPDPDPSSIMQKY